MKVDRVSGEKELLGYLGVPEALGDQLGDLGLLLGETVPT
jgi:hypothetical protein